ncbi:MAG: aldehyde dehydrogenase family protein [Bdellovibrio sp.]|nr:aldehyde dehydrogenase family protein [Bdellovibrio sp.]
MIFTLYYSNIEDTEGKGEKIHHNIGYNAKIVKKEQNLPKFPETVVPSLNQLPNLVNPNVEDIAHIYLRAKQGEADIGRMSITQRLTYIAALKRVILNRREEIIDIIQRDTKKARTDALVSEIFSILDHLDFLLKAARKGLSDIHVKTPVALMGKKSRVFVEPMGTILVISPWNYPFYQAIVPITTSFVAGNATIYKPSEYTPLTGLVEQILDESGFNNYWVQVVYGDGKVGQNLIAAHPDKIFFTGSVATGQKIMSMASQQLIPVELELGGKDPMIVFEDANIERAVSGALWGGMTNTGQSCTAIERLYVHSSIYEKFRELLIFKARQLTQGQDLEGDSDMGLMTTEMQVAVVKKHLDEAKQLGARVEVGLDWDGLNAKIPPIILDNVSDNMAIWREETFGPVLPLMPFDDEAEVIHLANDSEYGLSASVWSGDTERAIRVARQLKTGNVSINNVMVTEGNHYLPFGGVKKSGIGRYKGVWGLHAFSNLKSVVIDANSPKIEANWYPYSKTKYQLFSKLLDGLYKSGPKALLGFVVNGLKLEMYSNKVGKDFTKR